MASILAKRGWPIHPRLGERLQLDCRPPGAALGRRVHTLGTYAAGGRPQLALLQPAPNVVVPHASWRLPLPACGPISEPGSRKRGRQQTPALAAGLTERVGRWREGRMSRVPPWPPHDV